jgi:hypothetical protein
LAIPVLAVGVAGYLASGAGAGPSEAAALAFDPAVPFRWSYSLLQGGGALVGWLLGAAIGPDTVQLRRSARNGKSSWCVLPVVASDAGSRVRT